MNELWYFYADWCPYCQKQNPLIDEFEQENPGVTVVRIESTDTDALEVNNVTSFPTFMVFKDSDFLKALNGLTTKEDLAELFA
jgi:thiol-disulfide isomerase/thioredoxin